MRIEDFLPALIAQQNQIKDELVNRPTMGPGADQIYLRAVGRYEGLEIAKNIILGKQDEEEKKERRR